MGQGEMHMPHQHTLQPSPHTLGDRHKGEAGKAPTRGGKAGAHKEKLHFSLLLVSLHKGGSPPTSPLSQVTHPA